MKLFVAIFVLSLVCGFLPKSNSFSQKREGNYYQVAQSELEHLSKRLSYTFGLLKEFCDQILRMTFMLQAFSNGTLSGNSNLENIGSKIAKNIEKLPQEEKNGLGLIQQLADIVYLKAMMGESVNAEAVMDTSWKWCSGKMKLLEGASMFYRHFAGQLELKNPDNSDTELFNEVVSDNSEKMVLAMTLFCEGLNDYLTKLQSVVVESEF